MIKLLLRLFTNPADIILPSNTNGRGALYLGSILAVEKDFLTENNIDVVISMIPISKIKNVKHYIYPIADNSLYDRHMKEISPIICGIIEQHRCAGNNILVHCRAGMHRSPTIVIHYLQSYRNLSANESKKLVQYVRPVALLDHIPFDLNVS